METFLVNKQENQRHGILLVDEMGTRTSILVNSQNLTYTGLVDFGEENVSGTSIKDTADHGLVLMFQPLADTYIQPIAVFASKGPTKGSVLAKVIVKAIILLEKIGAKVHGVVSDGARPNRKFWVEMGLSAKMHDLKNFFEHPLILGRKIYVFSDTPHLMKTIRNRLYENKILQVFQSNLFF